ncbi:TPA: DNA-binding protein, partial [Vibrio alginolyticus]
MDWITAKELIELPGVPNSAVGIRKMAERENWESRRKQGVQGRAIEFSVNDLPPATQAAIYKREGKV